VQSGSGASTVTFDGAETELNAATGVKNATWKIEGPEELTEPNTGSALTFSHKFRAPGHYTIRLALDAEGVAARGFGERFSAQPQTLDVTPDPDLPLPTVTGVSPDDGTTQGGAKVTITGTDLSQVAVVKFGDTGITCQETEATCKVIGDTEIVATAPALPAGAVDVHVINGAGESAANSPADRFTSVVPPTVTEVTPNKGLTTGGTEVTITGTDLGDVTELKFGDVPVACTDAVTTCKVEGDTEIKATTPVLAAGIVDVHAVVGTIESPTDAPADQFTAVLPKFTLTVTKGGSGAGNVSSSPGGINCGVACSASFDEGASVTLTESAASGSTFAGWEGACAGTASTCVVTVGATKAVTATFNTNPPPAEETHTQSNNNNTTPPNETKAPPTETTPPGPGPKPKTPAEILAAKRKAALKKCQKLKGKPKAMCVKKTGQIGKPKKKNEKGGAK
jgi:hypothetical protein